MKTQTSIPKARTAPPQQPTPPEPRRNHPAHEVALLALLLARAALDTWQEEYEDLDDDHDRHDCTDEDCDTCKGLRLSGRLSGMAQCLGWIFGDLESEAYPRPQAVKRVELLLRDGCDLDPERLAQAFIKLMSPADEPAAVEVPAIVPTVEEDGEQVKGTAAPLPVDVAF